MEIVDRTWEELGHVVRPYRNRLCIRTDPPLEKTKGGVVLPAFTQNFYHGMLHLHVQTGVVVAIGSEVKGVEVGERVAFVRKYFIRLERFEDNTMLGTLREGEIAGIIDPDLEIDRYLSYPDGDRAVRERPM